MAQLTQAEKDMLITRILKHLSSTRYACASLRELSGGTTNFVFRGELAQPLSEQESTPATSRTSVIVKHASDGVKLNRDFTIDVSRAVKNPFQFATW